MDSEGLHEPAPSRQPRAAAMIVAMSRRPGLLALLLLAGSVTGARAQEPPAPSEAAPSAPPPAAISPVAPPTGVQVSALAAPDAFSTPGRETGLPKDLWRGASLKTAKA